MVSIKVFGVLTIFCLVLSNTFSQDVLFTDIKTGIDQSNENGKPIFLFLTSNVCDHDSIAQDLISKDEDLLRFINEKYNVVWEFADGLIEHQPEMWTEFEKKAVEDRVNGWRNKDVVTGSMRAGRLLLKLCGTNRLPCIVVIDSEEKLIKGPFDLVDIRSGILKRLTGKE